MKSGHLFEILHVDLDLLVDYFGKIEGFCRKDDKYYYFSGYDTYSNVTFDNDGKFCVTFYELNAEETDEFKNLNAREMNLVGKTDKYLNLMNEYHEIESELDDIRSSVILGDNGFFEKICTINGDFINWWSTPTFFEVVR